MLLSKCLRGSHVNVEHGTSHTSVYDGELYTFAFDCIIQSTTHGGLDGREHSQLARILLLQIGFRLGLPFEPLSIEGR